MTVEPDAELDAEREFDETVSTNGKSDVENSFLGLIKQDLEELEGSEEVYIKVPGYDGSGLSMKFRLPKGGKELELIAKKVENQTRQQRDPYITNLYIAMDTIIALCTGFYVKPFGVEDYVMLDPTDAGLPVTFDDRLATVVGLPDGTTAREIMKKLFNKNEMAIINIAEKLSRWIGNTKADLTREIWQLGE